jgi:hypothetical protein
MAVLILFVVFIFLLLFIRSSIAAGRERRRVAAMTPTEREVYRQKREERMNEMRAQLQKSRQESAERWRETKAVLVWGEPNPAMICPHCQTQGSVRTQAEARKAGVSGGKATAALLTGGTSLLLTGLSRKQQVTQAHCDNCNCTWAF